MWHALARASIVITIVSASMGTVFAQSRELKRVNEEIEHLSQAGKFVQAIPAAERAVALTERAHGSKNVEVGRALNTLADLYLNLGRYTEAERSLTRGLLI